MITKSLTIRRSFLVMGAGVVLFASGDRCVSQDADQQENEVRQMQLLFGAEGLDVVSPELKSQRLGPTEQQMLPPGTESLEDPNSPDNLEPGRRNLEPPSHLSAQRPSLETKYFREQLSQQIDSLASQGNDVRQLRELVERLQVAQENSEKGTRRKVEVAVFAVPAAGNEGPEGSPQAGHPSVGLSFTGPPPARTPNFGLPGFGPPGMRMGGRAELHPGQGPQIHHPGAHSPEGPFAEDRQRIAALTESAERIALAGLPDVAHGLRERAGQLERELAEKREQMQQEEHKRAQSQMRDYQERVHQQQSQRLMEQWREGSEQMDRPAPPLRELHEQMEGLRREMHGINERLEHLTDMIEHHHGHREDLDKEDEDMNDDAVDEGMDDDI